MRKEKLNYYDEFINDADFTVRSSKILNEYIEHFNSNLADEKEEEVHKLENEADKNLHKVLNYLIKDFVPPFDREDIIMIAHAIDDLEDNIDEVVINIDIFGVDKVRDDAKRFTALIEKSCLKLKDMFIKFKETKKFDEIHGLIVEINEIEDEGDTLYQEAIRNLFKNEKDAIKVIIWKNIYNCLENCLDASEKIANNLEEIVLKLN